jgi:hypothetical protein
VATLKTCTQMGEHGLDCSGSERGLMAAPYEHANEPSVSIKCRVFPDQLRNYWLLKEDCPSWSS